MKDVQVAENLTEMLEVPRPSARGRARASRAVAAVISTPTKAKAAMERHMLCES